MICGLEVIINKPAVEPEHFDFSGKTILNVTDSLAGLDVIALMLETLHANYIRARDGAEAVEICRQNQNVDLILMDIQMPIMDGLEAAQEIRKFNPNVPIIGITYSGLKNGLEVSKEAGCNDIFFKPVEMKRLIKMIDNYLKK